ncbi:MAG: 4'-phosphopantetheinyl transferase superfamily protein [Desulfuromonadales bacterium]|nr:4'-phosphopantetheinyl transferase superfamily protein [Desulfuromonadales bacterium]
MRLTTAINRAGVTIHTMNPVHGRGPVFYTSTACANQALKGSEADGTGNKQRLVSTLWDHLAASESPLWKLSTSSNKDDYPIQVFSGLLGRPRLMLGEERGPAISFSTCGGRVWAALCGDESDIGIDVAGSDEFQGDYPYQRVFHPEELEHALKLTGGVLEEASALLWTIKEAAVKALGCAFHLVGPLQITVYPLVECSGGGYTFPVGLSGKSLARFPLIAGQPLRVRSLPHDSLWLSIALVTRRPTSHE